MSAAVVRPDDVNLFPKKKRDERESAE